MSKENEEQEKSDLSKYYDFTYSDEEHKKSRNLPYFEKVEHDKTLAEGVIAKIEQIRRELKEKIAKLQKELAEQSQTAKKGKENFDSVEDKDLARQDLQFCKLAYVEGALVKSEAQNGKRTLEDILEKREERSYSVIVDVALKPLPSDRVKDKNRDKDNDKGKDKNGNGNNSSGRRKLKPGDLDKLRNGQPLQPQTPTEAADISNIKDNAPQSKTPSVKDGINNLRQGRKFDENETLKPVQKTILDKSKISDYVRQ